MSNQHLTQKMHFISANATMALLKLWLENVYKVRNNQRVVSLYMHTGSLILHKEIKFQ